MATSSSRWNRQRSHHRANAPSQGLPGAVTSTLVRFAVGLGVGEAAIAIEARVAPVDQLFDLEIRQLAPGIAQCALEEGRHLTMIAVRAAHGLVHDLVHQPQRLEAVRGDAQGFGRIARSLVFHRIDAQPSGEITEYTEYCSIST